MAKKETVSGVDSPGRSAGAVDSPVVEQSAEVTLLLRGKPHGYALEHAENILATDARLGFGDFALPDDSPFTFLDGSLRRRSANPADQSGQ